ncbi:MAG: hypothetical protein GX308_01005 [Epulopiscium sp.]|nr:hypothetical protein [Candidatus Epulonipiscium sp.]
MNLVCPLCNALKTKEIICETCHTKMEDGGMIGDYYDDYSPYLPISITARIDGCPPSQCVHLFYCPKCGRDKRVSINKQEI